MTGRKRLVRRHAALTAAAALWLAAASPVPAQTAAAPAPSARGEALAAQNLFLNARIGDRIFRLDAQITRPAEAAGPLPVALFLHGKDSAPSDMERSRPGGFAGQAADLAARGWMSVVFTRRGFGRSDGRHVSVVSCASPRMADQFAADAEEVLAVLDLIRARPDADGSRIMLIGVSAGGMIAMAAAARRPAGLKALVNISGGLNLTACADKGDDGLVEAMRALGGEVGVPQLWIYADNDELFPLALVNRMHEAALAAGADIRRISLDKLEPRGHNVFGSNLGRRTWLAELDKSLRGWGLPTYKPAEVAEWLKLMPGLNRNLLEQYQSDPGRKALFYSAQEKALWWRYAVGADRDPIALARADCEAKAKDCRLILVGNRLQTP